MSNSYGANLTSERWGSSPFRSSESRALPLGYSVDLNLPSVALDWSDSRRDVLIAAGRFVAIGRSIALGGSFRNELTHSDMPTVTLYDGNNTRYAGVAASRFFRPLEMGMNQGTPPAVRKQCFVAYPYIVSVNGAYGVVRSGDRLTGHWGSISNAANNAVDYRVRGAAVRWVPKSLFQVNQAAGTTVNLTAATLPGITPRVVFADNAGALYTGAAATLAFNGSLWVATFASNVTRVVYEYGQDEDHIAGDALSNRNLVSVQNDDLVARLLETGEFEGYEPLMLRRNTIAVSLTGNDPATGETPTDLGGGVYRVANRPVSPIHAFTVYVQGTVTIDNVTTTFSASNWYQLPVQSGRVTTPGNTFSGPFHTVNWLTGIIELAANITVTAIRVTYTYVQTTQDESVLWGAGVQGVTDGNQLTPGAQVSSVTVVPQNPRGLPADMNIANNVGRLEVWAY